MNELLADTKSVLLFLLGAVVALFGFIGRRHLKEFDELKRRAITRDEVERMHEENGTKLDDIAETTVRTHERIDQLYRDLLQQKKQ